MTESGDSRAGTGPWWWSRPRSAALDIALAAVSATECSVQGLDFGRQAGIPAPFMVVLGVLVGSTLVARRRWPIAVVLVSVAVSPAEMGVTLGIVGLYTLAATEVPRRITALLAAMSAMGTMVITTIQLEQDIGRNPDFNPSSWFVPLVAVLMAIGVTAPPVLLGLYIGARRRLVESLRERADGLERELSLLADRAEERAEWARNEERTRIAREMHDVVAHRVSLMVVHAAALQAVALKDPEKAARNAALVGDMGRQALNELRTMLGVLRSGESGGTEKDRTGGEEQAVRQESDEVPARLAEFAAAAAGAVSQAAAGAQGDGSAPEPAPSALPDGAAPSLAELEELVGESRAAGMAVDLNVHGEPVGACPPPVEQTAYRVVQEALTNVHKHAAGARTRVRVAHREAEVALQVENEPAPVDGAADAKLPSGGNGLVGMRERVTALGGGFVSGPTEAGGFRVSAVIPYAAARP
ncbi:sensor histidine kinase [Streptomyces boncukensis]|uniref:histidine kinase n=1 Tax=Streptomyces boncukensis TaxID=2711219 RepID=A0A6G4X155_9ACTN|nr:histidine kinase [Streptomyces boncukensis]NGO70587.1 sensor histidine kinase [Streptomyces boncukensis]